VRGAAPILAGLLLCAAQEAPLPPLEAAQPPEAGVEAEPLRVLITPKRFEEMADAIPDWAEIPLGNGEVGNLLGFLERTLEHEVDFHLSELMRRAKARMMPEIPLRRLPAATVAGADLGFVMGGEFRGLRPDEVRLELGVPEDAYAHVDTGRGIYPAVSPIWCPAGPLNCGVDMLGMHSEMFRELGGEK